MKNKEKLNKLKMVLTNHSPLKVDLGDGCIYTLKWDENIKAYKGNIYIVDRNYEIGIWKVKTILEIAENKLPGKLII